MGKNKNKYGSAVAKCPLKKATAALIVWVVRKDDKKLIGKALVTIAGLTNDSKSIDGGVANFDPVDPGAYTVSVSLAPNEIYKKAKIVGTHPRPVNVNPGGAVIVEIEVGADPIKIRLLDAGGKGVGDEPFELTTPDGRVVKGKLNKNGEATVTPILPGGDCRVRFPKRDSAFWKFDSTSAF